MVRRWFYLVSTVVLELVFAGTLISPHVLWVLAVVGPVIALGLYDVLQNQRTILRNFPLLGHGRYLLEAVRPEIQQYFIESNIDAVPDRARVFAPSCTSVPRANSRPSHSAHSGMSTGSATSGVPIRSRPQSCFRNSLRGRNRRP